MCNAAEMFSTVTAVKGVASPSLPTSAATCTAVRRVVTMSKGARVLQDVSASRSEVAARCRHHPPRRHLRQGWRGLAVAAGGLSHLGHQALNQVADGHAAGDGVRVDDDVRHDALLRSRRTTATACQDLLLAVCHHRACHAMPAVLLASSTTVSKHRKSGTWVQGMSSAV